MPHVSRHRLSLDQVEQLSQRIVDAAFLTKSREDLRLFFSDLLTTTEKVMLGKRLLIGMMIERGYKYEDIRQRLGVTDMTIAAVSERLKIDGRGLRAVIHRLERQQDIDAVIEKFGRVVTNFVRGMPKMNYIARRKTT